MAFDISLGESPPELAIPSTLDGFYDAHADRVVAALSLICDDAGLAERTSGWALTRLSQRWSDLRDHSNPVGWVLHQGVLHGDQELRDRAPLAVNRATGGYVRGLGLSDALAALPFLQRAALVTSYFLEWSDEFTAAGFELPAATVRTRRERAVSFLAHHLRAPDVDVEVLLRDHFSERHGQGQPETPAFAMVRRRGRRRTVRNRVAAVLVVATLIVVGSALFRTGTQEHIVEGPDPVSGPHISPHWFDPVSDGRGAFIALNTQGASRFVRSDDGTEWFEDAVWNSRAIDLRTRVTSFQRAHGRYLAVIEAGHSTRDFIAPHVAWSTDLSNWTVRQLPVDQPRPIDGLHRGYRVVASAASESQVLVALQTTEELDATSLGFGADDVCAETLLADEHRYFLCDQETVIIADLQGEVAAATSFLLASDTGGFEPVELPANSAARSLVGFQGGFGVADATEGHVWISRNGVDWERATTTTAPNRLVLLDGDERGALVVEPDASGWRSRLISPSGIGVDGDIPLTIDPEGVWSRPDLASGPAGWALFVTTSRPWERAGETAGWAVADESWIVSQLPDTTTITAQSLTDDRIMRFEADGPWVERGVEGTIVLLDPNDGSTLVEVTSQQIEAARPSALDDSRIKAQVLFTPDGATWTPVWSSVNDAWSGSIAVGDDELLLSGTQLTGGPITIELPE